MTAGFPRRAASRSRGGGLGKDEPAERRSGRTERVAAICVGNVRRGVSQRHTQNRTEETKKKEKKK